MSGMASEDEVVGRLERIVASLPEVLESSDFRSSSSILNTRVASLALDHFDVASDVQEARLTAVNSAYHNLDKDSSLPSEKLTSMRETDAWRIDIQRSGSWGDDARRFDGHLVLIVEDRWVLDLTLRDRRAPSKEIPLENVFFGIPQGALPRAEPFEVVWQSAGQPPVYATYTPIPGAEDYLLAPDWTMVQADDPLVQALIDRIK